MSLTAHVANCTVANSVFVEVSGESEVFLALEKVVLMAVSEVEFGSGKRRRRLSQFGFWFGLSSVYEVVSVYED
jgi:hypothetical protein